MANRERPRATLPVETSLTPAAPADAPEYLKTILLGKALEGAAPPSGYAFRYRLFDDGSLMVEVIRDRNDHFGEYPLFGAVVPQHELLRRPEA